MNGDTDIATRISEACDRHRAELLALVLALSNQQCEIARAYEQNEQAEKTRRTLDQIKAKDFVSPNEAAELLGCSPQHLRNLIHKASDGNADYPIPFRDLDGVKVFPLPELLEWSRMPKPKLKKAKGKNKAA